MSLDTSFASVAPVSAPLSHDAQRRAAIDMIATMRARAVRSALFATYLYRPNPVQEDSDAQRDSYRTILREQYDQIARGCALLRGTDPQQEVSRDICRWIADHAGALPDAVRIAEKMRDLTRNVVEATNTGGSTLNRALQAHFDFGRSEFHDAVTTICDSLWSNLDEMRNVETRRAEDTAQTITGTLKRLEGIGKHVRLVSLNASVEAARVGEDGKGLGVIAVEFKSLAEEIQALAVNARAQIDAMTSDPGETGS